MHDDVDVLFVAQSMQILLVRLMVEDNAPYETIQVCEKSTFLQNVQNIRLYRHLSTNNKSTKNVTIG